MWLARARASPARRRPGTASPESRFTIRELDLERLEQRYGLEVGDVDPKVYWELVKGWIQLTVRFLVDDHGIRDVKDAVTREIIAGFDAANIHVATTSFEISAIAPLRIERSGNR